MFRLMVSIFVAALFVGQTGLVAAAPLTVTSSTGASDVRQTTATSTPEPVKTATPTAPSAGGAADVETPEATGTPEATPKAVSTADAS